MGALLALSYADDLAILSPSLNGLQKLVEVCEQFGKDFDVTFNPNKSECIAFSRNGNSVCKSDIYLDGKPLGWTKCVKHLGNYIMDNLSEQNEVKRKLSDFIASVNYVRATFGACKFDVLKFIFRTYCTSFYGCQAWNFKDRNVNRIYTAWNKAVRILFNLPWRCRIILYTYLFFSMYHMFRTNCSAENKNCIAVWKNQIIFSCNA